MAEHWRTSRRSVGGNQISGSPLARDTQRDSNVVYLPAECPSLRQPNSRAADLDRRAGLLFVVVVLGPIAAVGCFALAYLTFRPQPVQYVQGMPADRFKGH